MIRDAESGKPGCPKASVPRDKMYAAFICSERERIERKRIKEGELDPKWGDGYLPRRVQSSLGQDAPPCLKNGLGQRKVIFATKMARQRQKTAGSPRSSFWREQEEKSTT